MPKSTPRKKNKNQTQKPVFLPKQKKWTHHHTQRLYHITMLASFGLIIAAILWGMFAVVMQVSAETQQKDSEVSAVIPGIETTTSTPISETPSSGGGGGSYTPPVNNPYVTVQPESYVTQQKVTVDGKQVNLFIIDSAQPVFLFDTNIPGARILADIYDKQFIRGAGVVDTQGKWQWQVPTKLSEGVHTIYVLAEDPQNSSNTATTFLNFLIQIKKSGPPLPVTVTPPPAQQYKFNVLLNIPEKYKNIYPGQEVVATVKVLNFADKNHSQPAELNFTVKDPEGKVILENSETLTVTNSTEFSKPFFLHPTASPGKYIITVSLNKANAIAYSSDFFEVKSRSVISLTSTSVVDYTIIFQTLLVLLFLFLLVAYLEYNKVVVLSRVIKQLKETDLKSEI